MATDTPAASAGQAFNDEWPLRFKTHSFSVYTYSTYGARVEYAGIVQIDEDDAVLQRSSGSHGADYQKRWDGTHIGIDNFPAPAKLSWRSKDGVAHRAELDIAALFADEVIRHGVPREEVSPQPASRGQHSSPAILLEINDRTVNVYMRAMVFTKTPQVQGNPHSRFRFDLVRVKSLTF